MSWKMIPGFGIVGDRPERVQHVARQRRRGRHRMSKLLVGMCGSSTASCTAPPRSPARWPGRPGAAARAARRAAVAPAGHHLDPAVGEVPGVAGEAEAPRVPGHEPAEAHALHLPRHEEPHGVIPPSPPAAPPPHVGSRRGRRSPGARSTAACGARRRRWPAPPAAMPADQPAEVRQNAAPESRAQRGEGDEPAQRHRDMPAGIEIRWRMTGSEPADEGADLAMAAEERLGPVERALARRARTCRSGAAPARRRSTASM